MGDLLRSLKVTGASASSVSRVKAQRRRLQRLFTWVRQCLRSRIGETPSDSPSPFDPTPAPPHAPLQPPTAPISDCNDGFDNDGDSWVDAQDSDCAEGSSEIRISRTLCQDGIDNDGDGLTDSLDPGCTADLDQSEVDVEGECSDGLDNDGDGTADYPVDSGCDTPASDEMASSDPPSRLRLRMGTGNWLVDGSVHVAPGLITSLKWDTDPGVPEVWSDVLGYPPGNDPMTIVANPTRFFLHSTVRAIDDHGESWRFGSTRQSLDTEVRHSDVTYLETLNTEQQAVIESTDGNSLQIRTTLAVTEQSVVVNVSATSLQSERKVFELPLNLPRILFPESSGTKRLRGTNGGLVSENFSNGTSWEYPDVPSFAPVVALWQTPSSQYPQYPGFSIGVQVVSHLDRPDGIVFEENNLFLLTRIIANLDPGETKHFTFSIAIAPDGDWESALSDYRKWFQWHHGSQPLYCPPGSLVHSSGTNTSQYDHLTRRFRPGTTFGDLFSPERTDFMQGWFQFAGFWETAIDSRYASPQRPVNKESWVHLFDPNLSFGADGSLEGFLNHFHSHDVETLWFTRPNFGLEGYQVEEGAAGEQVFTPGRVLDLDYTYAADRDLYLSYLDRFAAAGVTAFYVDAFDAPGGAGFAHFMAQEFERRYGRRMTIIVEGTRATFSNVSAQIPIISNADFETSQRYGVLIDWLTPYATFYGGRINSMLSAENTEAFVARGRQFQPVVLSGFPNTLSRQFCEWLHLAYLNRAELHSTYANSLRKPGVPDCREPMPPPVALDSCEQLPSFTEW